MGKNYKIGAVIYIGSNAMTLKIAEVKSKKIKVLEHLEYPLSLGKDTFTKRKIGFEKVDKMCDILTGFLQVIGEYGVKNIKIFATTALREAKNKDSIVDQIRVRTGLEVDVIDDPEEKTYIYKEISRKLKNYTDFVDKEALITSIGTGSVGVAAYSKGNIIFNQTLRVGSLKLTEIFETVQEASDEFYLVVEEYLNGFTYMLKNLLPISDIKYFIASGQEMHAIAELCCYSKDENFVYIKKKDLYDLYEKIKNKTTLQLIDMFNMSEEKAEVLLPSLCIYKTMFEFTTAEEILSPYAVLSDIVLFEMLYVEEAMMWEKIFYKNTILSTKNIAKRYFYNENHASLVEKFALQIFDKLEHIHGLGNKERLILQVSAILHDIGKYMNMKSHYDHSYNIIRACDILGLKNIDLEIAANVARYHSAQIPTLEHRGFKGLEPKNKMIVMKLSSIVRIADALERSHEQKFNNFEVKYKNGILEIVVTTDHNIMLEEWTFKQKSEYFEEVFGIKAVLRKKRHI